MGTYVPDTKQEQQEMLREIGFNSFDEMFSHIPEEVKLKDGLDLMPGISQGILQSIFEYQTMICELTGMDASNASIYDGATAAAEAAAMCRDRKRSTVYVSGAANPGVIEVIKTYCFGSNTKVIIVPEECGVTDADALARMIWRMGTFWAALYMMQAPNTSWDAIPWRWGS